MATPDDVESLPGLCFCLPRSAIEGLHAHRVQKKDTSASHIGLDKSVAKTLSVIRIEMKILVADLPKDAEYVNVGLTLDYEPEQVAGQEFILPTHHGPHYQMRNGMAAYMADYTNCRRLHV